MTHPRRRLVAGLALAGAAVLALAGPASAHVTVNPNTATQGGFAKLSFRVPTESDTASTTKLDVQFPADQPLAFVSVRPHSGWSFKAIKKKLSTPISIDGGTITEAITEVVWTADSATAAIHPGEFDEFDVSVGPLPKASSMTFKALQTYSDGSVVRWIEATTPGAAEPEHPAPVLTLTPASAENATANKTAAIKSTSDSSGGSSGKENTALVLSILALVLGAGGLGLGLRKRA